MVVDLLQPRSVVDVGCGSGHWLAAFIQNGVSDVLGIEGDWLPAKLLQIPPDCLRRMDLRSPISLPRHYDLALCLEVAEHLPEQSADKLVESLTQLAPAILFSAAIPHQGGVGHINEQWPEYWRVRFERSGFLVLDCFRSRIWEDNRVEAYYAQNILLYVSEELWLRIAQRSDAGSSRPGPLALVHPTIYLNAASSRNIRLRTIIKLLPRLFQTAVAYRLRSLLIRRAVREQPTAQ